MRGSGADWVPQKDRAGQLQLLTCKSLRQNQLVGVAQCLHKKHKVDMYTHNVHEHTCTVQGLLKLLWAV